MITREMVEMYKDSYEKGMSVEEYVEFFHDCIKATPEGTDPIRNLSEEELKELAEVIIEECTPWYAVMVDREDTDHGYGSHDLEEAKAMCRTQKEIGHPEAYIAVIDPKDDFCMDTIEVE